MIGYLTFVGLACGKTGQTYLSKHNMDELNLVLLVLAFLCLALLWVVWRVLRRALALLVCFVVWLGGGWFGGQVTALDPLSREGRVDDFGQVVAQPPVEADGVGLSRHAPVSLGLCSSRLRRRARWVRRVEDSLALRRGTLGSLIRGRWIPDLPSSEYPAGLNVVLSQFEDGAILLGGGEVQGKDGARVAYYHVELSDGSREVLFPDAVSKLASYALLRQRDATLVSALRLRALEWCKSAGIADDLRLLVVSSTLRLVFECSKSEASLEDALTALGPAPLRWWQRA